MEAIRDFYDGVIDAYDKVYPWIPASWKNSVSTFASQLSLIAHTAFTNPSDLPTLMPSIISTLFLAMSLYWTLSSAYYTARRGFRIMWFLTKYGSMVALMLGTLGWMHPDEQFGGRAGGEDMSVTFGRAVLAGWHTVAEYFGSPNIQHRRTGPNSWSAAASAVYDSTGTKSSSKQRKPWERFENPSFGDAPSSNTRAKASKSSKDTHQSDRRTKSPLPFSPMDLVGLGLNNGGDALSALASALGLRDGHNDGNEHSAFERALKEVWERATKSDVDADDSEGTTEAR